MLESGIENQYKILIVHPSFSKHISRFICRLKQYNNEVKIDFLTTCQRGKDYHFDFEDSIEEVIFINLLTPDKIKNKLLRFVYNCFIVKRQIRALSKVKHYDVINIHYPEAYNAFGLTCLKKMCKRLVITPWGSDVYQLRTWERPLLERLYDKADYVTGLNNRFTDDVKRVFNIPDNKIVNLTIASETADYICSKANSLTKETAKEQLGIKGYYGIVCGYNGNPRTNHLKMFEAINSIKDQIPVPIVVLVQITYGYTEDYLAKLKAYFYDKDLKVIFFDHYLDMDNLYRLMMAADMFIFVADTDSNSGVLKEYIYLEKKVILGEWLKYDDLLRYTPLPYFPVESFEALGETIVKAFFSEPRPVSEEWKSYYETTGYNYWIPQWDAFYKGCMKGGKS